MRNYFPLSSRTVCIAAAIGMTVAAASFVPSVFAAPQIGTSAAVRGDVFVTTRGANRKAKVRDAIKLQDKVLTKDNSALQILLLDRSTFTVGQNCSMVIDKFVYDPETSAGEVSAKVAKGAFRFMSGRIGKNNPTNAKVSTPSATIGIRGTFFEGIVGEDAVALAQLGGINTAGAILGQASITILRGPGRNRNTLDTSGIITVSNSGGSVTLTEPHFAVFVGSAGSPPIGPFRVTSEMQEYLDFFLRSEPNGPPVDPLNIVVGGEKDSGQDRFKTPATVPDDANEEVQDGITDPNGVQMQYPPPVMMPDPPPVVMPDPPPVMMPDPPPVMMPDPPPVVTEDPPPMESMDEEYDRYSEG